MSYDDFCRLTPGEFEAICGAFYDKEESKRRDDWERMRLLAAIVIQPHVKKKLTPKSLLPFNWDKKKAADKPLLSKEESRKRFLELMAKQKRKSDEMHK